MSGNNRQGRQGGQGGQQPQGGQPRGGQQPQGQRGQQPQGGQRGRGQAPQGGGRPPQQGGESSGGGVDTDAIRSIVVWGVAAFAVAGLVFGLAPFLFGFAGDANGVTEQVSANSTQAQEANQEEEVANNIISNDLSNDNQSAAAAYSQMQSQNSVINLVIGLGPYFGILFAVIAALLMGLRSSADEKTLAAGVAVTTVVGLVLFVVLSTAVAGFQYNSMSEDDWVEQYNTNPDDWGFEQYPASDVDQESQEQFINDYQDEYGDTPDQNIAEAASIPTISTISALNISYGTLVTNSLLFGIVSALGGAGIAVASSRISGILE